MTMASETPVLDTLAAMTMDSIERCGMSEDMLILTRIAALAAMDAPAISYLAHIGPAIEANVTVERMLQALRRFLASTRAATAMEYAVLLGLLFLAVLTAISAFGQKTSDSLDKSGKAIQQAMDGT